MLVGVMKRKPLHRMGGGATLSSCLCSVPEVGMTLNFLIPMFYRCRFIWFFLLQRLSFVDVATGWFGQGLGAACGMAYTGKYFDRAR